MTVDTIAVQMAFGGAPHTPTGWSWTDVSAYVVAGATSRGRESRLEQMSPGTLTVTFDNTDGRFDPSNLDGPYVSGGATQLRPKTPIRVRITDPIPTATTYTVFTGYLDDPVTLTHEHPGYSTATYTATDALSLLATYDLPQLDNPIEDGVTTATRATRILTDVGFTDTNTYDVAGDTILGPTVDGGNALEALQNVALAEGGALWVTGDGVLTLDDRYAVADTRRTSTQATYLDDPTAGVFTGTCTQPVTAINRNLYNVVTLTNERGNRYEASDATSIGLYGKRSYDISGAPLKYDAPAESRVDYWLQALKDPYAHWAGITVNVLEDGTGLTHDSYNHRMGAYLELHDRVRLDLLPAQTPTPTRGLENDQSLNVERIEHLFERGRWTYRLGFDTRDRYEFANPFGWMELDNPSKGLDSIYVLTY